MLSVHDFVQKVMKVVDTSVVTLFQVSHRQLNLPFQDSVSLDDDKFPTLFSHALHSIDPSSLVSVLLDQLRLEDLAASVQMIVND